MMATRDTLIGVVRDTRCACDCDDCCAEILDAVLLRAAEHLDWLAGEQDVRRDARVVGAHFAAWALRGLVDPDR